MVYPHDPKVVAFLISAACVPRRPCLRCRLFEFRLMPAGVRVHSCRQKKRNRVYFFRSACPQRLAGHFFSRWISWRRGSGSNRRERLCSSMIYSTNQTLNVHHHLLHFCPHRNDHKCRRPPKDLNNRISITHLSGVLRYLLNHGTEILFKHHTIAKRLRRAADHTTSL